MRHGPHATCGTIGWATARPTCTRPRKSDGTAATSMPPFLLSATTSRDIPAHPSSCRTCGNLFACSPAAPVRCSSRRQQHSLRAAASTAPGPSRRRRQQRRDHSAWHRLRHILSFLAAFAAISLLAAPARCGGQPPAHEQQLSRAPTSAATGPSRRRSCILWRAAAQKHDRTSDRQEADGVLRSCSASSPGGAYPPASQPSTQTRTTGLWPASRWTVSADRAA
jgi:hypothetical protein